MQLVQKKNKSFDYSLYHHIRVNLSCPSKDIIEHEISLKSNYDT